MNRQNKIVSNDNITNYFNYEIILPNTVKHKFITPGVFNITKHKIYIVFVPIIPNLDEATIYWDVLYSKQNLVRISLIRFMIKRKVNQIS